MIALIAAQICCFNFKGKVFFLGGGAEHETLGTRIARPMQIGEVHLCCAAVSPAVFADLLSSSFHLLENQTGRRILRSAYSGECPDFKYDP